jgi:hypothetical protein
MNAEARVKPKHIREFLRACQELRRIVVEVRQYEPMANLYLEGSVMHLMIGPAHDDTDDEKAHEERSACGMHIPFSDGGAW